MKNAPTEQRAAISRVLSNACFEVYPSQHVLDQIGYLPDGATIAITASETLGTDATLDLAAELRHLGYSVIPHVAARLIADAAELRDLLARLDELEVQSILLIGGDAREPGDFKDAYSVMMAMASMTHGITEIGVAGYPEGHPIISDDDLSSAIDIKASHAGFVTTQMSFHADAISSYATAMRRRGIMLPVYLGLPGVVHRARLLRLAAKIRVGDSIRFLRSNVGLLRRFVTPRGYNPDHLLTDLGAQLAAAPDLIAGVHLYTFNECRETERWRQRLLERLG